MNIDKMECMYFKQDAAYSTLNGKLLKLVKWFIYLGSNISSTKSNVTYRIGQVWTAMEKLSIIKKSDHSDENKTVALSVLLYSWNTLTLMKRLDSKKRWLRVHLLPILQTIQVRR